MGRWLRKIQQTEPAVPEPQPSVSSVSMATGVCDEISREDAQAAGHQPWGVTPLLYRASDLMPELNLIPGPRNDEGFIDNILAGKSNRERHRLLLGYRQIWLTAFETEKVLEHQKDNAGRQCANRWLYEQSIASGPPRNR